MTKHFSHSDMRPYWETMWYKFLPGYWYYLLWFFQGKFLIMTIMFAGSNTDIEDIGMDYLMFFKRDLKVDEVFAQLQKETTK